MVHRGGMQRQFLTAKDEVFANGDLVYLFKGCFTLRKFALNKKFLRFARRNQVDIVPVAVRANVDLLAYQRASWGSLQLKVCDIELPADPTVDMYSTVHLIELVLLQGPEKDAKFESNVNRVTELNIMAAMLDTHAEDLRRLKIHMSLNVELSDDVTKAPFCVHINKFLSALAKCTGIETLIIYQTDHVVGNANLSSTQCKLFEIIKTMHKLKVLDFCGNMMFDAVNATLDPINGTQNQLTMIDYLPTSISELIITDGPVPRMHKWTQFYGFPAGLKLSMCNSEGRFPLLKSLSLPSSFWSLTWHEFGRFVFYLNSNHITTIRVSDPFKLNKRPSKPAAGEVPIQKTKFGLHYLIASLVQDMVIDIRGADEAERVKRIQWAMEITTSSVIQPIQRSDGAGYTTITMHKSSNCTVQVLI